MKTLTAECYQLKAKLSERISMLYRFENGLDAIDYKLLYTDTFFVNKRIGDENNYDFLRSHPDPDKLQTVGEKLRWHRLHHDLMQKDCAAIMQVDRGTYADYEENTIDAYPLDKLQRLAEHYQIDITELLDDYNLFLLHNQSDGIKALRSKLHMTQEDFAKHLQVPIGTLKNWESNRARMTKSYYTKLFG
jgi:transcriptional regulator with XRE-family HTH domain